MDVLARCGQLDPQEQCVHLNPSYSTKKIIMQLTLQLGHVHFFSSSQTTYIYGLFKAGI
jgi:hypothetical protein